MLRIFAFALFFLPVIVKAADDDYAVSKIPLALRKNANAVLRLEETSFEIKNTRHTVETQHFVITILNENGDHWADVAEGYDKHRSIESLEGILYDGSGKVLKRMRKKDAEDLSGVSEESLIDDNRVKHHNFYYKGYPYTIEYTIEIHNKTSLFFPMWAPQGGEFLSVEKSSMSIISPLDYEVRYKAYHYTGEPATTVKKNEKILTWSVSNMPAFKRESYSPLWHDLTTIVLFGPTAFQVDSYQGNMKTWQDFGKFIYALKAGRDVLPENIKKEVHAIADPLTDKKEKVNRLYQFLQKNTRYISVQLGIGGWQPFEAKDVAAKRYGDCKALTNYMYSLLKEAGINSYYALVRAGKNATYITTDFPSQQFNHVILCVPVQKDTVWLECTSQTMPAGYLGDFTSNRPALLVDEQGGTLVQTPAYGLMDNSQVRHIKAVLDEEGTLELKASSVYSGLQQDDIHGMINSLSKEKIKEYLHRRHDFPTYTINSFDYKPLDNALPAVRETLDISVSNYATVTGKRLFIAPNSLTVTGTRLTRDTSRKYDINLDMAYTDVDSSEIILPAGYVVESIPQPVNVKSRFGSYKSSVQLKNNTLYYYRSIERQSGKYPAAAYNELVDFYQAINAADRARVVLVKK